jgi:taurine dioxygenase
MQTPTTYADVKGAVHPIVRVHPETQRRALYLGRTRVRQVSAHIVEMPDQQGDALLDQLWAYATDKSLTWSHSWKQGDLVIWDNRVLLHQREKGDGTHSRVMHRVLTIGDPVLGPQSP